MNTELKRTFLTGLIFGLVSLPVAYIVDLLWNSRISVSFRFGVAYDNVIGSGRPEDCDFTSAPIGFKGCYYQMVEFKDGETVTVDWKRDEYLW